MSLPEAKKAPETMVSGAFRMHKTYFLLLSIFTRPSWMLCLKKSFTEQPARPEEAHAQAQAQEDTQAQEETQAQEDAQEE